ncbi:hypothetical protein CSUB01_09881 [Colletotrichum sublineola]|uniref:Uncharacterized protein n=1 Tax=Colletotrichum sublineola TaxID=1173701 RepID=A0A066XC65_COLSU|nr:hypothetical protein CSUB01_09881 [Colletotrichum sublineola]
MRRVSPLPSEATVSSAGPWIPRVRADANGMRGAYKVYQPRLFPVHGITRFLGSGEHGANEASSVQLGKPSTVRAGPFRGLEWRIFGAAPPLQAPWGNDNLWQRGAIAPLSVN